MLKFKQFINEEYPSTAVIAIDTRFLENNRASLNDNLDTLTSKPYQNAVIFLAQLRGTLERYGMLLPQEATPNFLGSNAELVYPLGDTAHFLYIVYNTNMDGFVDGYAQVVEEDELKDLVDMDKYEMFIRNPLPFRHSDFYRKKDDDSGNSDEY